MTPKTDVETRYDARSGVGPVSAPEGTTSEATGWDRRRASVSWSHVLPLAVVLAFANGFWIIALRGAIGAIERTSAPFSTWWHESTLLVPVYVVAVLAAFVLAQRWFGSRPHGLRPVAATIGMVTLAATAAGTLLLIASSWFDFRLQRIDLHHMGAVHPGCDPTCAAARVQATLNLEIKGVWIGLLAMLVTDLVLVALVVAFRGGDVVLAKAPRPAGARRREGARLVVAAGLLGAAAIHAALIPERLDEWQAAGVFLVALALAQVAAAATVLARDACDCACRDCWPPSSSPPARCSSGPCPAPPRFPFRPDGWEPKAVGVSDVLCCALELMTLTLAVVLLRRSRSATPWSSYGLAIALTAVLAATVIGDRGRGSSRRRRLLPPRRSPPSAHRGPARLRDHPPDTTHARELRLPDRLGTVESNHGRMVIGVVLLLAITAGFEFELAWLFVSALVLFFGWLGYLLLGPET